MTEQNHGSMFWPNLTVRTQYFLRKLMLPRLCVFDATTRGRQCRECSKSTHGGFNYQFYMMIRIKCDLQLSKTKHATIWDYKEYWLRNKKEVYHVV